jgi:hypothetical protein
MFGRLQAEYLQRLVFRCLGILLKKDAKSGVYPPEQLRQRPLRLQYVSPLARAQQMEEVAAMDSFEAGLIAKSEIKPELIDLYDWDAAERKRSELLGVPQALVLDGEKLKKARKISEDKAARAAAAQGPGGGAPALPQPTELQGPAAGAPPMMGGAGGR